MNSPHCVFAPVCAGLLALAFAAPVAAQFHVPGNYATIQAAVDAAPSGATIHVAAGVYAEQVVIDGKDLRVIGAAGAVVRVASGGMAQTLLPLLQFRSIWSITSGTVKIRGFTFDGEELADLFLPEGFAGCSYVGANGQIRGCHFTGFRATALSTASQTVAAVYADNPDELGTTLRRLTVSGSTFTNNKNSMVLSGDSLPPFLDEPRLRVRVSHNTVTGVGPTADGVQNGIVMQSDVGGTVAGNTISDHINTAAAPSNSNGLVIGLVPALFGQKGTQNVICAGNTVSNNRVGISVLDSSNILLWRNTVVGTGFHLAPGEGIGIVSGGHNTRIIGNDLSDMPLSAAIVLLGTETIGGALGVASDTWIFFNSIDGSPAPIVEGTGVTGTIEFGNNITP